MQLLILDVTILFTLHLCGQRDLWFDGDFRGAVVVEPLDVNLAVKMSDVTDDRIVQHLTEVGASYNVLAAGRRYEYPCLLHRLFHRCHLKP